MSARLNARIRQNKLTVWNQYIELANSAYESGQFSIGNKMLRAASGECACDAEMCLVLAETYERFAQIRVEIGELAQAEQLLKRAISMHERIGREESLESINRLLMCLAVYMAKGNKHEVALRYLGKAMIVSRRLKTISSAGAADQARRLCQIWTEKGRHNEANLVFGYLSRITVAAEQHLEAGKT